MRHTGEMQDPVRGPALISLSKVWPLVLTLSNGFSRNLQRLVSLCEHGTVYIIVHHINLLADQMNCMKILPIYCYNDDDFVLITTRPPHPPPPKKKTKQNKTKKQKTTNPYYFHNKSDLDTKINKQIIFLSYFRSIKTFSRGYLSFDGSELL